VLVTPDRKAWTDEPNVWVPRSIKKERRHLPMSKAKGTRRSLMQPQDGAKGHPFYHSLQKWGSEGVLVDCGPDWEQAVIEQALFRGPHSSALDPENAETVREDIQYQVDAGFSQIFTWEEVKKIRPNQLKVSPMAVVPQKHRRGRIILDLSFPVYPVGSKGCNKPEPIQVSVNETTKRLAPEAPVKEIGNVFRRLLHFDLDEIVMLSKIDLSDGFWRMLVENDAKWNFAYVMPNPPGSPVQLVVPSALQMGCAESPAYFCAATETGCDISIQESIATEKQLPPHIFKAYMHPAQPPKRSLQKDFMHTVSVYLDDFIGAPVKNASRTLLYRITKAALHGIHAISPPQNKPVTLEEEIQSR
jgi:hypothetical protein